MTRVDREKISHSPAKLLMLDLLNIDYYLEFAYDWFTLTYIILLFIDDNWQICLMDPLIYYLPAVTRGFVRVYTYL